MTKRKIIIYADMIYRLGGIETWLYNLTSILKDDFDFLVLYRNADPNQLARLQVPNELYDPTKIYYCDILLNNINGRPYSILAKRYIQMIHANYADISKTHKYEHWNKTNGFIFVSETARRKFTHSLIGYDSVVLTNPVYVPEGIKKKPSKKQNKLKLMAATRLTSEKGGARIVQLVRQIHSANIDVEMHIWTNWTWKKFDDQYGLKELRPLFYFHEPKLGLYQEMADCDYVVQLSDCESFCYTIHESLAVHTPVLVTNWNGVTDYVRNGVNGYIFNMDMSGIFIKQLLQRPNTFGVAANENSNQWKKYLQNLPLPNSYNQSSFNYFLK